MPDPGKDIQATDVHPSIDDGDRAAVNGEWPRAVEIWSGHLAADERLAAASRIRWFLSEVTGTTARSEASNKRQQAFVYLMVGVGCGLVGTAMVLIGENRTGTSQDVFAALAWALYIATAILAVTYAYKVGRSSESTKPELRSDELARAIHLAALVDPIPPHSTFPPDRGPQVVRR